MLYQEIELWHAERQAISQKCKQGFLERAFGRTLNQYGDARRHGLAPSRPMLQS